VERGRVYVSNGQSGFASTWIRSGLVAASSLYTAQEEEMILFPPEAAQLRVSSPIMSQTTSVWKGCQLLANEE
jgi:hypothetical protein